MNIEIEIKISIENFKEIKKKLASRAKFIKSIRQIDEYYVPVHRNFFARKPHPVEWLRIRTNPDKTIFEYDKSINKKANGEQDYAEEYETKISNPSEFRKILSFLNFKKVVTIDKQREYWRSSKMEIVLDKIKNLGYFIETEAIGRFQNAQTAKIACFNFLKELGIENPENKAIYKGYPVLLLEKLKNKKF